MINQIQLIGYGVVIIGLIALAYFYHFKPINDMESRISKLEEKCRAKDNTINNIDAKLRKCQEDLKQKGFIEYVEGMSNEINTTSYPKFTF